MGTLTERKTTDGKTIGWRARVRMSGYSLSEEFRTKKEAQQWIRDVEVSIQQGTFFAAESETRFTDLVDKYLQTELKKKAFSHQRKQQQHLDTWMRYLGPLKLKSVTPSKVAEIRDVLLSEVTRSGELRSPATVNRYLATLSRAFKKAVEWELVPVNPVHKVEKGQESSGRDRYLSEAEIVLLHRACESSKNPHLHAIVCIGMYAGLRMSEILHLYWSKPPSKPKCAWGVVILSEKRLTLFDTKNKETRSLPLIPQLEEIFLVAWERKVPKSPLVFPGVRNPMKPVHIQTAWLFALRRAGIKDFHFHDLRHTCGSYLAMSGSNPRDIAGVLGHKKISTSIKYCHLNTDHMVSVLQRANEKLSKK